MAFSYEQVGVCSVCGGSRSTREIFIAESIGLRPPLGVTRCLDCGFRWQNPRVTEKAIMEIYTAKYFTGGESSESFADLYASPPEDTRTYSSQSSSGKNFQQMKHIEILESEGILDGKSFLEIGCGRGGFLNLIASYNVFLAGVEPSSDAVAEACEKGLNVITGTIGDLPREIKGRQWDIIYLSHVFEHIYDPAEAVSIIYDLLSNDGFVFIEVPNQFDAWTKKIARTIRSVLGISRASTIYSIHHLSFFNLETLRKIFLNGGFEVNGVSWTPRRPNSLVGFLLGTIGWVAEAWGNHGENIYIVARKSSDDESFE